MTPPLSRSWLVLAHGDRRGTPADVRGQAEKAIAVAGVVADAAVRTELAEDLTARAVDACVPLLDRSGVPEHVRSLPSAHVVGVEVRERDPARVPSRRTDADRSPARG